MEVNVKKVDGDANDNISGEAVLYDVLNKIFANLSLKDLCRASAVCKSWQYSAKVEISNRNNIETLLLPITNNIYWYDDADKYLWNKHFSDSLRSSPAMILLFMDDTSSSSIEMERAYFYYLRYLDYTGDIIKFKRFYLFASLRLYMNTTIVHTASNIGIGLTIPSTSKLQFKCYIPNYSEILNHVENNSVPHYVNQIVGNLLSTEDTHNCFIFFRNTPESEGNYFLTEFSNNIRKWCEPGTYSLWGGDLLAIQAMVGRDDYVDFFILRISGSAFNSWSIVLNLELPNTEVKEKLINFKKNIHLKTHSIAMAILPSNLSESSEQKLSKTKIFREIFFEISLVGVYQNDNQTQVGVNSLDCDINPVLEHKKSVVYLILSTD